MPEDTADEQAAAARDNVIEEGIKAPAHLQLLPARHTKTLFLVRHGEGYHNVAGKQGYHMYSRQEYYDAHLTAFGWQQATQLREYVDQHSFRRLVDVIIVSPLSRALETAVGAFGGADADAGSDGLLMRAITAEEGKSPEHPAVSSEGVPPFVAWEGCREHIGMHPCDQRRPLAHLKQQFPAIDFSLIETEEDTLWRPDVRESAGDLTRRGIAFLQWLMRRPEQRIAVVTHSSFLLHMLSACGGQAAPKVQEELHEWFANAEMRTVVLSDTTGPSTQDVMHFPGYRIENEHAAVTEETSQLPQT